MDGSRGICKRREQVVRDDAGWPRISAIPVRPLLPNGVSLAWKLAAAARPMSSGGRPRDVAEEGAMERCFLSPLMSVQHVHTYIIRHLYSTEYSVQYNIYNEHSEPTTPYIHMYIHVTYTPYLHMYHTSHINNFQNTISQTSSPRKKKKPQCMQ